MYEINEIIGEPYDSAHPECKVDFVLTSAEKSGKSNAPLYIHFHGGGLEGGGRREGYLIDIAMRYGISSASADYRMYPNAHFPDFINDAARACAYVKEKLGGKYKKLIVGGSSAGAYLAMMLYFAPEYLAEVGLSAEDFHGFIFDAGQPTTHFNVLRERGIDSRAVRVDEAAPIYYIDKNIESPAKKPPVMIINAETDMDNRYEQTMLLMGVMRTFGYNMDKVSHVIMKGFEHCGYCGTQNAEGEFYIEPVIAGFIEKL